jgi:hypothetical protein
MFDDSRILASALLARLNGADGDDAAAILRRYPSSPSRA